MKSPKAIAITLTMATCLLALTVGLRTHWARLVAEHLAGQFDTVPDDRAAVLLGQIAALGEPGISALVEALDCDRESVALAGKRVLMEQFDHWRTLTPKERSRRLAALAAALADQAPAFGPTARTDAAELTKRILSSALDPDAVERSRVNTCCAKVLRIAGLGGSPGGRPGSAVPRPLQAEPSDDAPRRLLEVDESKHGDRLLADADPLPGGGLPVEPASLRPGTLPPAVQAPGMADARARLPAPVVNSPSAEPWNPMRQPRPLWVDLERLGAMPDDSSLPGGDAKLPAGSTGLPPPATVQEAPPAEPGSGLREVDTVELMRRLRSENRPTAFQSEVELVHRGFQAVDLELARQLFDPDPEVRKRLVQMLPRLQSVNPVPWLLQLGQDADSEVRLAAIGLMATTGDPQLLQQIEQMARRDPDPRIQRQASRITDQSSGQRYH